MSLSGHRGQAWIYLKCAGENGPILANRKRHCKGLFLRAGMALGSRTEKAQARKRERRTEALPEGMTSVCQGRLGHNACCTGCEAAVRQRLEKRGDGHAHNGSGTAHARQESAQQERTRSCKLPETQDAGIGHAVRGGKISGGSCPLPHLREGCGACPCS